MTERPSDSEQSLPPEDIAALYARARTPHSPPGRQEHVLGLFGVAQGGAGALPLPGSRASHQNPVAPPSPR